MWVNDAWLRKTKIPEFENDFGVSEEVERCIYKTSVQLIHRAKASNRTPFEKTLKTLSESALHSRSQYTSVEFLRHLLATLDCIHSPEDVFKHFTDLSFTKGPTFLNLSILHHENKPNEYSIDPDVPSLKYAYYTDPVKYKGYESLLKKLGALLHVKGLEEILPLEKKCTEVLNEMYSDTLYSLKGRDLVKKFSKLPWHTFFSTYEIDDWKDTTFYYTSPRWLHCYGHMLHTIPIDTWKLYLARCYILLSAEYLPPPYDLLHYNFFGHVAQGQKQKMPQLELLVNMVYEYLHNPFSELFWKSEGSEAKIHTIEAFTKHLVDSAKKRLSTLDWLSPSTRKAASHKISAMRFSLLRPSQWPPFSPPPTLDPKSLLLNRFLLGKWSRKQEFSMIGKKTTLWEEGIFRVNAYYYPESNEIRIPFGTTYSPFYKVDAPLGWNYGALGSILGHEMCHGFDEDGKEYGPTGKKDPWWKSSDNRRFNKKTKGLVEIFNTQHVMGKQIDGKDTLDENIADLAGLGISLDALKQELATRSLSPEEVQKAMRTFFIAYAFSWRTKYRDTKLRTMLGVDRHAPAFLRVNLIISQFDEWYDAFSIPETSPLYIPPAKRIRIF